MTARLVVGADGRNSRARGWGGFQALESPDQTFCAGLLFDDMAAPDDTTHNFRVFHKTPRDVRVLRDRLISHDDWDEAGHAYAQEYDPYFTVCNTVQSWNEKVLVETGPEADALRAHVLPLCREDPARRLDTFASGPDHPIDETVQRRFFGED